MKVLSSIALMIVVSAVSACGQSSAGTSGSRDSPGADSGPVTQTTAVRRGELKELFERLQLECPEECHNGTGVPAQDEPMRGLCGVAASAMAPFLSSLGLPEDAIPASGYSFAQTHLFVDSSAHGEVIGLTGVASCYGTGGTEVEFNVASEGSRLLGGGVESDTYHRTELATDGECYQQTDPSTNPTYIDVSCMTDNGWAFSVSVTNVSTPVSPDYQSLYRDLEKGVS